MAHAESAATRTADIERARRLWLEGLVIPAHITMVLDALGLFGPEVDESCGAKEPDVAEWEAGRLYPSFEQICALAELTGKSPRYFMGPITTLSVHETSMRFHVGNYERARLSMPVHRFTQSALLAAGRWGVRS